MEGKEGAMNADAWDNRSTKSDALSVVLLRSCRAQLNAEFIGLRPVVAIAVASEWVWEVR
eukprot:3867653-Rhodomonas_salina.2